LYDAAGRDRVRSRLLELARADERIVAAALTGSLAGDRVDEWSDIDLAFALGDNIELVRIADDWAALLDRERLAQMWLALYGERYDVAA
jgi:predicted nucleotidyltransferase